MDIFQEGEVEVRFPANKWTLSDGVTQNVSSQARFTIQNSAEDSATSSDPFTVGPLFLDGPSVSLADVGFDKMNLVLAVAVGADSAGLDFGDGAGSGITAELTGLLGTFEIRVDILIAVKP